MLYLFVYVQISNVLDLNSGKTLVIFKTKCKKNDNDNLESKF